MPRRTVKVSKAESHLPETQEIAKKLNDHNGEERELFACGANPAKTGFIISNQIFREQQNYSVLLNIRSDPTDNNSILITTDYPQDALSFELSRLPEDMFERVKITLENTELRLEDLEEEDIAEFKECKNEQIDAWLEYEETVVDATQDIGLAEEQRFLINNENMQYVYQGTLVLTSSAKGERPVLVSDGAGPCYILAAYNKTTGMGFLAHIDYDVDIDSLQPYFDLIGSQDTRTQVHLVGGMTISLDQGAKLVESIKQNETLELKSCSLRNDEARQLALNVADGNIFYSFGPKENIFLANLISGKQYASLLSTPGPRPILNATNTPLCMAVEMGDVDIVKQLLSDETDKVNKVNGAGKTPLHIACELGRIDLVELLLTHKNIKIDKRDGNEETPLDIARKHNFGTIEKLIKAGTHHTEIYNKSPGLSRLGLFAHAQPQETKKPLQLEEKEEKYAGPKNK